jgi:hypothetical protein
MDAAEHCSPKAKFPCQLPALWQRDFRRSTRIVCRTHKLRQNNG